MHNTVEYATVNTGQRWSAETGLVDETPHVRRGQHRFLTPAPLDPLGVEAPGAAFRCETGEAAPPYHLLSPSSGRVVRCRRREPSARAAHAPGPPELLSREGAAPSPLGGWTAGTATSDA